MKALKWRCLFPGLILLLSLLAATTAAAAQTAAYQSVRGIKVEFTPSPRTGRYRFEVYEPGSADALCSKLFDSVTAAQTVFLPVECQPGESYTIRVTALPEPERMGLDSAASKEQVFTPQPVCGHTVAEGGFLYGSGTAADPYIVSTPAQLRHLDHAGHRQAGEYFLQSRDIDLLDPKFYQNGKPYDADDDPNNGNWVPISKKHDPVDDPAAKPGFVGCYDGGGHTLYHLTYSPKAEAYAIDAGVFGYISEGVIQNLGVEDFSISGAVFAAGGIAGSSHSNTCIRNCKAVDGVLKSTSAGGIVGYFHSWLGNLELYDCYSAGIDIAFISAVDGGLTYRGGGGIAGHWFSIPPRSAVMKNVYSIPSTISGPITPGGVIGSLFLDSSLGYTQGIVSDSYYLPGSTSYGIGYPASNSGAAPLGEGALADESSFPGWDFTNTWTMGTVTYTDASGSERTVAAPVLRVFEHGAAMRNYSLPQGASSPPAVSLGFSD